MRVISTYVGNTKKSEPWSNELDFLQYNMQHLSSGKSRDRLTTLFIHVETCRNMLYVVERGLIGIKNVASTNVVQQYISFVSVARAGARACFGTNKDPTCNNVQPNVRQILPVVFDKSSSFDRDLKTIC